MKTWIISISAITILTTILGLIIPEGKSGKLIKSIFSVLIVFVVMNPLSSIKNQNITFEQFVNTSEIVLQNDYLDFVAEKKVFELEKESVKIIEKMGVNNAFVNIFYKYDESKKFLVQGAEINLKNAVIISDKAHIDIKEEMKKEVSLYLQIDKNNVFINE